MMLDHLSFLSFFVMEPRAFNQSLVAISVFALMRSNCFRLSVFTLSAHVPSNKYIFNAPFAVLTSAPSCTAHPYL